MKLASFLPALAVLGLSGCVTGYGYSDDGYYYGRPEASVGSYGSIGYGSPGGWRYGYGMGYGAPGYYGYYDPYSGYYYDPYYGYYFPRPPVVIIQRPPGDGHDHDGDDHDHDGHKPPPWRDLDDLGNRGPHPVRAPDATDGGARPRLLPPPQAGGVPSPPTRVRMPDPTPPRLLPPPQDGGVPSPPTRVRMPDPTPPRVNRVDSPRPSAVAPSMPRMDDDTPMGKGDRRR